MAEARVEEEYMDDEIEEDMEDEIGECQKFVATQVANVLIEMRKMNESLAEMKKEFMEISNNNATKIEEFHQRLNVLESSSSSIDTIKRDMAVMEHRVASDQIKISESYCKMEDLPELIEKKLRSFYTTGLQAFNARESGMESFVNEFADSYLSGGGILASTPAPCMEVVVNSGGSSTQHKRSGDEEGNQSTEAEKRSGDDDPRFSALAGSEKSLYTTFDELPCQLRHKLLPYNTNASMAKGGVLNGPQRALVKFHVRNKSPGSTSKEVLKREHIFRNGPY